MSKPDIHLYTATTMNGWKPIIFLEEAGVDYELTHIDFNMRQQKEPWYIELNPNGRIPTIVDRSNEDFAVFESGAILWYLAEKYNQFLPNGAEKRSEALQWMMFQMSAIGPMMGQAMYFQRIAAPQGHEDEFAIKRFVEESHRLLEILDKRLEGRNYILGDDYSIVDMATYPWARCFYWAKVDVSGLNNLNAWFERIDARPAVQRALEKPKPFPAFMGKGDVEEAEARNANRFKADVKS